ncbi:putative histone deacetylase family protein [Trichinella spiralis]|uniref:putative histone deacetylase family protein n=1 Tax=Trichinella spiralis TaxID=6334 RepID=UPI0001EFE3B7|nr:putative histone deacetylase family protein [Trichinella spiralis]
MSALYHIAQNDSPSLPVGSWSSDFHDFVDQCLIKDPALRFSTETCLLHPFISSARPTSILFDLIQRTKLLVRDLDHFQYRKLRKLMYLDEQQSGSSAEVSSLDSEDIDSVDDDLCAESASSRSDSYTSTQSLCGAMRSSITSEEILAWRRSRFATIRPTVTIAREQTEYAAENNMHEQMSGYKRMRREHQKELKQLEEKFNSEMDNLKMKLDREYENLLLQFHKEMDKLHVTHRQELDKRLKTNEELERKLRKAIVQQQEVEMKALQMQLKKEYKVNKERLKQELKMENSSKSFVEGNLKTSKQNHLHVQAEAENRLIADHKFYLDFEIRKLKRRRLLHYHQLEQDLIREELGVRGRQLQSAHTLLRRHHELTRDLEMRQLNSLQNLRCQHLQKQHASELQNQQAYMKRVQDELRKKHAMQVKQQPKELKQKELQIRRQFRQAVKTQTRQYKLLQLQLTQDLPKDEQREVVARLKDEQKRKLALLAEQYEGSIGEMMEKQTVQLETWQEEEARQSKDKLNEELELLMAFQSKQRMQMDQHHEREKGRLNEKVSLRLAVLENKMDDEVTQFERERQDRLNQLQTRQNQELDVFDQASIHLGFSLIALGRIEGMPILKKEEVCVAFSVDYNKICDSFERLEKRSSIVFSLLQAYGLLDQVRLFKPLIADESTVGVFHSDDYISFVKNASAGLIAEVEDVESEPMRDYGLGYDCPIFPALYEYGRATVGATVHCAQLLVDGKAKLAVNVNGGWHHARRSAAAGFCYFNDCVIGILKLRERFKRVLYIDLDAHHGDAVEDAFCSTRSVLTVSLHCYEAGFYPCSGSVDDVGVGSGKYYAVNVPFRQGLVDEQLLSTFDALVPKIVHLYRPEVVFLQLGTDGLAGDPVAAFNLTPSAYAGVVCRVLGFGKPCLLVGGGGYKPTNVSRCWALVLGALLGQNLDDDIPEHAFFSAYGPDFVLCNRHSTGTIPNLNTDHQLNELHILETKKKNKNGTRRKNCLKLWLVMEPDDDDLIAWVDPDLLAREKKITAIKKMLYASSGISNGLPSSTSSTRTTINDGRLSLADSVAQLRFGSSGDSGSNNENASSTAVERSRSLDSCLFVEFDPLNDEHCSSASANPAEVESGPDLVVEEPKKPTEGDNHAACGQQFFHLVDRCSNASLQARRLVDYSKSVIADLVDQSDIYRKLVVSRRRFDLVSPDTSLKVTVHTPFDQTAPVLLFACHIRSSIGQIIGCVLCSFNSTRLLPIEQYAIKTSKIDESSLLSTLINNNNKNNINSTTGIGSLKRDDLQVVLNTIRQECEKLIDESAAVDAVLNGEMQSETAIRKKYKNVKNAISCLVDAIEKFCINFCQSFEVNFSVELSPNFPTDSSTSCPFRPSDITDSEVNFHFMIETVHSLPQKWTTEYSQFYLACHLIHGDRELCSAFKTNCGRSDRHFYEYLLFDAWHSFERYQICHLLSGLGTQILATTTVPMVRKSNLRCLFPLQRTENAFSPYTTEHDTEHWQIRSARLQCQTFARRYDRKSCFERVLRFERFECSSLAKCLLKFAVESRAFAFALFWFALILVVVCFFEKIIYRFQGIGKSQSSSWLGFALPFVAKRVGDSRRPRYADRSTFASRTSQQKALLVQLHLLDSWLLQTHVRVPLNPSVLAVGVFTENGKVYRSLTCPVKVSFRTVSSNFDIMYKSGDDLRQDSLVLQMIHLMDHLWLKENLDLRMVVFRILPLQDKKGVIELVKNSKTLREIQVEEGGMTGVLRDDLIQKWLQKQNPSELEYQIMYKMKVERENVKVPSFVYRSYDEFCEFAESIYFRFPLIKMHSLPRGVTLRSNVRGVASDLVYTFFHPIFRDEQADIKSKTQNLHHPENVSGEVKVQVEFRQGLLEIFINHAPGLKLMYAAAKTVMNNYKDIRIAYGHSDEFSFVFWKRTDLWNRRLQKFVSTITSLFTSNYIFQWNFHFNDNRPLIWAPCFDGRVVLYPTDENLTDYLKWRQADCHINNLYNTVFWKLVNEGQLKPAEAEKRLCGSTAADKNEILFSQFNTNYNNEPDIFRKGTVLYRNVDGETVNTFHGSIIDDQFWQSNAHLLN